MVVDVPRVKASVTVLEAAQAMNRAKSTGVAAVNEDGQVVGLAASLRLLREFLPLNKGPEDVKVSQVMAPFYRIGPNASAKEAARKILAQNITRLGVSDDGKFLGWVSLAELTREFSKKRLIELVRSHDDRKDEELLCPNCRSAFMAKALDDEGEVLRWICPNCGTAL